MNKSKFSASSIVAPSIFVILLVNGTQFVDATEIAKLYVMLMISSLIKM